MEILKVENFPLQNFFFFAELQELEHSAEVQFFFSKNVIQVEVLKK